MGDSATRSAQQAVVVIIRREGRVLVIQRGPESRKSGYWSPPSGCMEPNESQAQTVVREMREELGLTVRPRAKVWKSLTDDGSFVLHWWLADYDGGELTLHPGEVSQVVWVTTDEFMQLHQTFQGGREFFRRILPSVDR